MESPKLEQNICLKCGLCCDGTLFDNAVLEPGEKGSLAAKMEETYKKNKFGEFFTLPCSYFDGKCSIYNQKKAHICSAFRCKLLKDTAKEKVSEQDAFKIVQNAVKQRNKILILAKSVFRTKDDLYFKKIFNLIKTSETKKEPIIEEQNFKMLKIQSLIFEALLTRHFKSSSMFKEMMEN